MDHLRIVSATLALMMEERRLAWGNCRSINCSLIYPSLQLSFTLVEILSINESKLLGSARNVTRTDVSTFKCRTDIDILVPEPSCAVGNTPDIDLLWQLSDSGISSPSDVFSHQRSRHF